VALSVEPSFDVPPACISIKQTWVTWHRALWCSDFPPPACARSDSPPSQNHHYLIAISIHAQRRTLYTPGHPRAQL